MKINVLNINGESTGREVELPEDIFGIEPNDHVVYLAVKAHLANKRQGTHKSKQRSEIAGSTRKIKRQKGTGTARAGDIKNPLFRGGGRMFGPQPRDYSQKLNKKVKRLARKSALSSKAASESIFIVEDFAFDQPKTKEYINILNRLDVADQKVLHVTGEFEKEVYLSGRNLPNAEIARAQDVHTYQILHADKIILSEGAIEKIVATFN